MTNLETKIKQKLQKVNDPEINISIIDLGLIYKIKADNIKKTAEITMTLTTIGCPLFDVFEKSIKDALIGLKLKKIKIILTFDPPWNINRMTKKGKAILGL